MVELDDVEVDDVDVDDVDEYCEVVAVSSGVSYEEDSVDELVVEYSWTVVVETSSVG